jgi:hypothetical protein
MISSFKSSPENDLGFSRVSDTPYMSPNDFVVARVTAELRIALSSAGFSFCTELGIVKRFADSIALALKGVWFENDKAMSPKRTKQDPPISAMLALKIQWLVLRCGTSSNEGIDMYTAALNAIANLF